MINSRSVQRTVADLRAGSSPWTKPDLKRRRTLAYADDGEATSVHVECAIEMTSCCPACPNTRERTAGVLTVDVGDRGFVFVVSDDFAPRLAARSLPSRDDDIHRAHLIVEQVAGALKTVLGHQPFARCDPPGSDGFAHGWAAVRAAHDEMLAIGDEPDGTVSPEQICERLAEAIRRAGPRPPRGRRRAKAAM